MVAAAAIGAAAIGAAGSAVAGSEAAGATTSATNAAVSEQNAALAQQANLAAPYTQLGQSAIPQLQSLLGIGTPGQGGQPSTASVQQALAQTPGYQFTQQQGTQNTLNAASAQGLALSGNTLQGLSQFNAGLADQTYQQAVGNAKNVVGLGQAAAAGQAANIGNAASNISNAVIGQGNTLAGIDANTIAGITKSAGNAANAFTTNQTLADLDNTSPYAYTGEASPGAGAGTVNAGGGYILNAPQ